MLGDIVQGSERLGCGRIIVDNPMLGSTPSDARDSRGPSISYPLNFLDELPTRDLRRANPLLRICCNRRVFIRIVKRVPEQHNIRRLQRFEDL